MVDAQHHFLRANKTVRFGFVLAALLAAAMVLWGGFSQIAGAVVANGTIGVDSSVKKIQHFTGGTVGSVFVREGESVVAGQVVVRLDDTVTRANLAIVENALNEAEVRRARLTAERNDAISIEFPQRLIVARSKPEIALMLNGEEKLFELRRASRAGQKSLLRERITQLRSVIEGLQQQLTAKEKELEIVGAELEGVRTLWKQNLISISRLNSLERDAVRIAGERGSLISNLAETRGKMSELDLQILQVDQDFRSEVAKDLRDTESKIAENTEKKVSAEDTLKKVDIRSPQDGRVYQLAVHAPGAVITPSDPIMTIVPTNDLLSADIKVGPQDIDQVMEGQSAVIRLTAFSRGTTPELNGFVARVAADADVDKQTGARFYAVSIALPPDQVSRLGQLKLIPGMPVESFIGTGTRSVISYLFKPLIDQLNRALRER